MSSASDIHAFLINSVPDIQSQRMKKTAAFSDSSSPRTTRRSDRQLENSRFIIISVARRSSAASVVLIPTFGSHMWLRDARPRPAFGHPRLVILLNIKKQMDAALIDFTPYMRHAAEHGGCMIVGVLANIALFIPHSINWHEATCVVKGNVCSGNLTSLLIKFPSV